MMKMMMKETIVVCVLVLLAMVSGSVAQEPVSSEPEDVTSTANPELFNPNNESLEFPECNGKSGPDYAQCIEDGFQLFNQRYTAPVGAGCYQRMVGTPTPEWAYVTSCPSLCPPYLSCTSIGGLCTDQLLGQPSLPGFFEDCPAGQVCVKSVGLDGCTSSLLGRPYYDTSTCTCSQNNGIFMPQGQCKDQCGATAYAADQPPSQGGAPVVCCINLNACPAFYEYTCQQGGATFDPQCSGNGNVSCDYLGADAQLVPTST